MPRRNPVSYTKVDLNVTGSSSLGGSQYVFRDEDFKKRGGRDRLVQFRRFGSGVIKWFDYDRWIPIRIWRKK